VWVFRQSGGIWSETDKLSAPSASQGSQQGWSVALSADLTTVLAGGNEDNGGVGAAWAITDIGSTNVKYAKLVGTDTDVAARQGWSVALSADASPAIVGGPADNSSAPGVGATWVFARSGGVWSQQGAKLVGTGANGTAQQGWSVALSGDGNTAIVGGNLDNSSAGAVWVFTRSGGVW